MALRKDGLKREIRIPKMAITTRSSMALKADFLMVTYDINENLIFGYPLLLSSFLNLSYSFFRERGIKY
jgi:hypothetical protein